VFVPALAVAPAGFFAVGFFRFDIARRRKRKTRRNRRAEAKFIYPPKRAAVKFLAAKRNGAAHRAPRRFFG
jgi:hypothetical protein